MSQKDRVFTVAADLGIKIIMAASVVDSNRVAIHLLNPNLDDLEDAIMTAERDNFPAIVIHSNATWGRS